MFNCKTTQKVLLTFIARIRKISFVLYFFFLEKIMCN